MDMHARLQNLDQQSHELFKSFLELEHRLRDFEELRAALLSMHTQMSQLQSELVHIKADTHAMQVRLPTIARREELDRLTRKLDATPFELYATKRDL